MILVSVGTFVRGFDGLVLAADRACRGLDLAGFAQIGHSAAIPQHLAWERFLPEAELRARLAACRLVICHGGMGILGEAMRAGRPILAVPRRGPTTPDNPANDQGAFLARLAQQHPITVCLDLDGLAVLLGQMLAALPDRVDYGLACDVPRLIAGFLARTPSGSPSRGRPARRSRAGC